MGWILRVQDNCGRDIKLDQAEFIHASPLGRGSNNLLGWLAETWTKRWLTLNENEMPGLP